VGSSGGVPFAEGWNGSQWAVQAVSASGGTDYVLLGVSCSSVTDCEAVGDYGGTLSDSPTAIPLTKSHAGPFQLTEGWNGSTWNLQNPPGPNGIFYGLSCVSNGTCEAVGIDGFEAIAARWNGKKWANQAIPDFGGTTPNNLNGVSCPSTNDCEAVGYEWSSWSGLPVSLAEVWNGTTWTAQGTPSPAGYVLSILLAVSCTTADDCEAVGLYENDSDTEVPFAEMWNGSVWTAQSTPIPSGSGGLLNSVSCTSADNCEAVGHYSDGTPVPDASLPLAEVWNGTTWTMQSTPSPSSNGGTLFTVELNGISCLSADNCEAVGLYAYDQGGQYALAEVWNGSTWTVQSVPNPSDAYYIGLDSVSCTTADYCEAVGNYAASNENFSLAEVWNGSTWTVQSVPNPSDGSFNYLNAVSCTTGNDCEAVGYYYENATGGSLALAEVWNGSRWALQNAPNPSSSESSGLLAASCTGVDACEATGYVTYEPVPGFMYVSLIERYRG